MTAAGTEVPSASEGPASMPPSKTDILGGMTMLWPRAPGLKLSMLPKHKFSFLHPGKWPIHPSIHPFLIQGCISSQCDVAEMGNIRTIFGKYKLPHHCKEPPSSQPAYSQTIFSFCGNLVSSETDFGCGILEEFIDLMNVSGNIGYVLGRAYIS